MSATPSPLKTDPQQENQPQQAQSVEEVRYIPMPHPKDVLLSTCSQVQLILQSLRLKLLSRKYRIAMIDESPVYVIEDPEFDSFTPEAIAKAAVLAGLDLDGNQIWDVESRPASLDGSEKAMFMFLPK